MEVYYFLAGLLLGLGLALFVFSRKEKEADRLKKELELQARDSFPGFPSRLWNAIIALLFPWRQRL